MPKMKTGNEIRHEFIHFFEERGHKYVPSSSLVPGGDQTLLFTNAGMVQFKDVFLGIDKRNYSRAVNSQKCMRVAGKHNDLDDVGRDDLHHTFFEMLGNWSFGDYYKKEAIQWAWELLTEYWGLDKSRLWVTCFKDEKGEIDTDQEAAEYWALQPGLSQEHILFFGRKENFWEMADIGPCGPCSEIHYDRGLECCDKKEDPNHRCSVNGDCHRFIELWNLVFIQYNRISSSHLELLPERHVDTGLGLERITAVMQGVNSNYRTDLFMPLIEVVMKLTGDSEEERDKNFTPYRVIADHARGAAFLVADGVVPGNVGRNYVCRMIIRRASRFGSMLGINEPFLSQVAEKIIEIYSPTYPELEKNRLAILSNLTMEEERFQSTVERGLAFFEEEIAKLQKNGKKILDGQTAFNLYATHGLPLEITRDVLRERGLEADQKGFLAAMEEHRIHSGAGKEFGPLGGEEAEFYSNLFISLKDKGLIDNSGVDYNPYEFVKIDTRLISLVKNGMEVKSLKEGESGEMILPRTGFYVESGGQVADTGKIVSEDESAVFLVENVRKPSQGMIVHHGKVIQGKFEQGMPVKAHVDLRRRRDIMRNHTATHLLQAELRRILGSHVRQAGSLVTPDHLRFDFTHPKAMTEEELKEVEEAVNERILNNYTLDIKQKRLSQALEEGATALFGEKYGDVVRTVAIGDETPFSYELCGGTHVHETGEIGIFLIVNESSVAAGIRRIEAITGRKAYEWVQQHKQLIENLKNLLGYSLDDLTLSVKRLLDEKEDLEGQIKKFKLDYAFNKYKKAKETVRLIDGKQVMWLELEDMDPDILRNLADQFRVDFKSGIGIFINIQNENVLIICTVSDELVKQDVHAGKIVKKISAKIGGSGGGRSQLAQGGGKDIKKLDEIKKNLQNYID